MTTEEKAKAYDEAMNKIKPLYEQAKRDGNPIWSTYEYLFSELRESEEERIRRTLVEYFGPEVQLDFVRGVPIQKIRDWLEKQKESLHITESRKENADSFTDACKDVIVAIEKYLDWLTGYPDYAPKGKYSLRDMLYCLSLLEKQKEQSLRDFIDDFPYSDQKEQKPAIIKPHKGDDSNPYDMRVSEAQEYAINRGFGIPLNDGEVFVDERYITQTIGNILRWADEHPKEQKSTPDWMPKFLDELRSKKHYFDWDEHREIEGHILAIINWIAPNYFKEKEQKPTERATMRDFNYHEGEPDEKAWSRLFAILNYAEATSDDTPGEEIQALTNWIEGKQKSAWSTEDERMLSRCIKSVECSKQFADSETYKAAKDVEMNWLKSLPERFNLQPKPAWSEEDELNMANVKSAIMRTYDKYGGQRLVNWFDLLPFRHQSKQEWSEEDKRILKGIIGKIDHDQTYGVSKVEMLSFLKSLSAKIK